MCTLQLVPVLGIDFHDDQEREGLIVFKPGHWFYPTNVPIRSLSVAQPVSILS